MLRRLSVLPLLLLLGAWEPLRAPDPDVEAGNKAYAAGQWQAAIEHYERARGSGVDEAGLDYNLGTAKLKLGASLSGAEKDKLTTEGLADLERVRKSKNTEMRAEASFNAGNTLLAGEKFEEAIESYKQSLRDNPEYADARANLELALRKLQKQQEQQGGGGGQGQPPPQGGQGQGQPPPQGGSGQGQPPPPPQGGSGGQGGQPPPEPPKNPDGTEQDLPPDDPPPDPNGSGGSGQPTDPPPDPSGGDSGQPPPPNGSNSGSAGPPPPKDPKDPQQGSGSGAPKKHGLPSRHRDQTDDGPRTGDDDRLEDLEKGSRDLRRGQVRGGTSSGRDDDAVDW